MSRFTRRLYLALFPAALAVTTISCPMPDPPDDGIRLDRELIADGFESPTFVISFPDDASRLLVTEQFTGRIWLIEDGAKQDTPFLDIGDKVRGDATERGLFSLAFHPSFTANRRFYVCYTDLGGATTVEEYLVVQGNPNIADPESGEVVLTVAQPRSNHNGGMIAFSPEDDLLYVGMGDGGGANDTDDNGQDLSTPLGKILRLDLNVNDLVPADNPFVDDPEADPLIWAYGVRNPWRFSFDMNTGHLYMGDVGQGAREEINFQRADSAGGENYGWRIAEGFACRGGSGDCGSDEGFTPPVLDYGRNLGQSVTGGYVYRGGLIEDLRGHYFYADFASSRIWSFRIASGSATDVVERTADLGSFGGISSFGQDDNGEIYIVDYSGAIYRIIPRAEATTQ